MNELVVDLFCGGGGASTGVERALDRPVDIAVNHSPVAIAMHERNHPRTQHFHEDVWKVKPREVCGDRPVGLLWLSPACTHFSRAKGAQNPKSAKIRSLAHSAIVWAREVKPRIIVLENVVEFLDWGPLDSDGQPIKAKKGRSFAIWLGKLKAQGYAVEWRKLVAADYGAPTSRERLFLVARRDGQPIVWPEPTHGAGRPKRWRTAAEIIDWSIPCPSIFLSKEDGRKVGVKRPLVDATLRRIAAGVMRFVVGNARPFIVPVKSWGGGGNDPRSADLPMRTITTSKRGEFAVVAPCLAKLYGTSTAGSIETPTPTVTGGGGHIGLVAGMLVQTGYGERPGQEPRALDVERPLGTVVAAGQKHAAVTAFVTKHYGGVVGQRVDVPASTVTAKDHHAVTTVTLGPTRREEVRAFLLKYFSGADAKKKRSKKTKRASAQGQHLTEPLHTITTRDRFALVTVNGVDYEIADIGMRMLSPAELWRAQGFPESIVVDGLTKSEQIHLCGNSVCPQVAEAIVRANVAKGGAK